MPNIILKSLGLKTFPHHLLNGEGSLLKANNVIINRDNIIEPRRGFKLYGDAMGVTTANIAKQLHAYKDRILRHYNAILQYDNGSGTFTNFSEAVTEVETGLRIKGKEVNSNFYFTTNAGIKKLSASSAAGLATASITKAGGVKALDASASLNSDIGFFTQNSVVAYRIFWGIKDANETLISGSPSERVVIYNPLTDLLIKDFNNLLNELDGVSNSGGINDGNYLTSLKVSLNSSSETLRTNLIALAAKLDNDTFITEGAINLSTTQRTSTTSVTIIFNSDVSTFLQVGDKITCTETDNSEVNNNVITITSVATTTIVGTPTTNFTGTDGAPVADAGTAATVKRLKYTLITQPVALSLTPTADQTVSMQTYYDSIVTNLQNEPAGIVTNTSVFDTLSSTQSSTVNLTFTIPQDVTTSHFYQVYRTVLSEATGVTVLSDLDPGDEVKLAQEANPTSAEITAKEITYQDITPESFLGANSYTNPNSGEGILKANEVPPLAHDIELFKGYTFYSNTNTKYRKQLNLLSITDIVAGTSTFTVTNGSTTNTYNFRAGVAQTVTITTVAGANYASSGAADYFDLFAAKNKTQYRVWFNSGTATAPSGTGVTLVEIAISGAETANDVADEIYAALNVYNDFVISNPAANVVTVLNAEKGIATDISENVTDAGFLVATTIDGAGENTTLVTRTGDTHSNTTIDNLAHTRDLTVGMFVTGSGIPANTKIATKSTTSITISNAATTTLVGTSLTFQAKDILYSDADTPSQQVDETARSLTKVINKNASDIVYGFYLSSQDDVPGIILLEARDLGGVAFYLNVDSTTTGESFTPDLPVSGTSESGDNEVALNRLYYSKRDQPEAVPILNYLNVGPKDKKILRIIALRDSLFILKEEAIYRLSGEVEPFIVTLFDNSSNLIAPDTASVLNNQIYCLTTQGVAAISDTGVSVISRPIENLIIKLNIPAYTALSTASHGVGYESDRSYYLWTVTNTSDTKATQCFVYNTFTNTWVISKKTANCSLVNPDDDKMYVAATDTNFIEQERKSFDRTDHADRETSVNIGAGSVVGTSITLNTLVNVSVGDVLFQEQYLTISQFNRLLKKLDLDTGVSNTNYYSLLQAEAGDNLRDAVTNLAIKLDADALGFNNYASAISGYGTTFLDTQDAYNVIVNKLNTDSIVTDSNYLLSSGTVEQEVVITSINTPSKKVTTKYAYNFIVGPALVFRSILCEVEWSPQTIGDPSVSKHFYEATFLFENNNFTSATVGFASDLEPEFEDITFNAVGNGSFGNNPFGSLNTFGGSGSSVPFRTYIPRNKQRCRYLSTKFKHQTARESFTLYGGSLVVNDQSTSTKAYKTVNG